MAHVDGYRGGVAETQDYDFSGTQDGVGGGGEGGGVEVLFGALEGAEDVAADFFEDLVAAMDLAAVAGSLSRAREIFSAW